MPDIRIEIPQTIVTWLHEQGCLDAEAQLATLAQSAAFGAAGDALQLQRSDFWTRVSTVNSNVKVVFVDVTLIRGKNRTPALRKRLAESVRDHVTGFLRASAPQLTKAGVLVWIHNVNPNADFAETEPNK